VVVVVQQHSGETAAGTLLGGKIMPGPLARHL